MNPAEAYIPIDRRQALATGLPLATESHGATLFVDISGFTPLTGALLQRYGPRRGAEELTRQLNHVYTALITEVERYRGSVIGFSGDAITCWFDRQQTTVTEATGRAIGAALAIQATMAQFRTIRLDGKVTISLAVKTAIAAGAVRRFIVGDPAIQLIDVLAGSTLDRMAAAEQMTAQDELIVDAVTIQPLLSEVTIAEWRTDPKSEQRYALVTAIDPAPSPQPWPDCPALTSALAKPWLLPTIAARLQGQQERFLAELRPAAALFLKFTGLDFDHDAQSPQKLDRYIQWVQSIINQHEGALIQLTTGDKGSYLYAAFGAPIAHDDDIQRAVASALLLRTPPSTCPFITTTQIGITYGTMRTGAYGSERCKTYGVLGNETNMAARLMTHATPGQIVISELIADSVGDQYKTIALGDFTLKGKAEPQPLFALLQPHNLANRAQRLYETELVGREAELARLTEAAHQVKRGYGCMVRIEGSAGLGKSHLVATFAQQAKAMSFRPIFGGGQSTAQGTAYFAIRTLLGTLLGLGELVDTPVEHQITTLTTQLTATNPGWALRIPLLADLLALPIPENATTAAFDARLRQEALIALTLEILQHYAQTEQLLLILEDIHWLDEASQGIVLALARALPAMPILLLLVHRPSVHDRDLFFAEISALPAQQLITLPELPALGVVALVEQRLQGTISPLAASLIQIQAEGNPFFTEELVDALVETGQLQEENGSWVLATDLVERLRNAGCLTEQQMGAVVNPTASLSAVDLGIPDTIQGIILARLDRLPEAVKLTVKVASVIGRLFGHELLLRAHPVAVVESDLEQEIETLLTREFARIGSKAPRRSYIFKHNITQEVVYQTLLSDQRYELHLGVATALEALEPERIEDLALHYSNSNIAQPPIRASALHYLEAAGQRAKRDYANETALRYFDRALALENRAPWLKAKVEVLHVLGRRQREQAALTALAAAVDADAGEVALLQGNYYEALSDYTQAEEQVAQALRYYRAKADPRGEVKCLRQLGVILARQADYERAQHYYQKALTLTETHADLADERAPLLYGMSIVKRQQGQYQAASSELAAALALYEAAGNRQGEARMLTALGNIAYFQRDYVAAKPFYQQALAIQQMIGDRTGEGSSLMSLGQAASSLGEFSYAEQLLNQSLQIFQATHNRWWEKIGHNGLGITAFSTGRYAKARQHFNDALTLSREIGDAAGDAIALLNLGQVIREQQNLDQAAQILRQSLAMANEQGDKDLAAQCWSDLAICLLSLGEREEAIQSAQQAQSLFTELGVRAALTTELCTLAQAYLQLADQARAENYIYQAFHLLEEVGEEGPDYPHRDYLTCHLVFDQLGLTDKAVLALARSWLILQQKAAKISDPMMRAMFLREVAINAQIVTLAKQAGLKPAETA